MAQDDLICIGAIINAFGVKGRYTEEDIQDSHKLAEVKKYDFRFDFTKNFGIPTGCQIRIRTTVIKHR